MIGRNHLLLRWKIFLAVFFCSATEGFPLLVKPDHPLFMPLNWGIFRTIKTLFWSFLFEMTHDQIYSLSFKVYKTNTFFCPWYSLNVTPMSNLESPVNHQRINSKSCKFLFSAKVLDKLYCNFKFNTLCFFVFLFKCLQRCFALLLMFYILSVL